VSDSRPPRSRLLLPKKPLNRIARAVSGDSDFHAQVDDTANTTFGSSSWLEASFALEDGLHVQEVSAEDPDSDWSLFDAMSKGEAPPPPQRAVRPHAAAPAPGAAAPSPVPTRGHKRTDSGR